MVSCVLGMCVVYKKKNVDKVVPLYNFLFEERGKRGQLTWEREDAWERRIALWCVV